MKKILVSLLVAMPLLTFSMDVVNYVDPMIGAEGLGRVFVGPSAPFGMIKPSPDGVSMPNSGWAPMPEPIKGFSQVHVSGTGGGQKYGNVLIMPFIGEPKASLDFSDSRVNETVSLGYYASTLSSGINVQITAAQRAAIYNIAFPKGTEAGIAIDAGAFLGMSPIPDGREAQMLVGSQIEIVSDNAIKGYNRVRGGWNNGRAYTVYFYAESDKPFARKRTWRGDSLSLQLWQSDIHQPTGAIVEYADGVDNVMLKIGISFISELKAKDNLYDEIGGWDFDGVRSQSLDSWDDILSRIEIDKSATDEQRRMFYTGLYHTLIMPTDRSGENPLWADDDPYYDDYYAIWDTYRTSSPMITLLDPKRQVDIVNSLLNIYKRDGYMPDARSGNSNGRTQGGSNAEIVIADALAKGLDGIDYEFALEAMLKDADVPPGGNEEAEGRGGLVEYNTLGYVPFGIPRAGNRTVEYSYCDYCIAQVAKSLGKHDVYERFMRQSGNWQNLWRDDYEHSGVRGFIMPRDRDGEWLDSLPQGHSALIQPKYEYTAMTFEGPWYTPWWSMFFYEAPSWEYSLSIPHDVPRLIEKCGGDEKFRERLDTFFDKGYYNVNNEPSFLSPYLYHWIGKPYLSSDRVHAIVNDNFNDTAMGLPGNDDSGAMSSWLAFNMIGIYPNAGQDYYLIGTPMLESTTFHLADGVDFTIKAEGLSAKNRYIQSATFNGHDYPYSTLRHKDLADGGTLVLVMGSKPSDWGMEMAPPIRPRLRGGQTHSSTVAVSAPTSVDFSDLLFTFKLHGQTRRYRMAFEAQPDGGMILTWGIERNLKWQQGTFYMSAEALLIGTLLDMRMPIDGDDVILGDDQTAYIISAKQYDDLKENGEMECNNGVYCVISEADGLIHVIEKTEGCQMWILDNPQMPIVWAMADNPLEVNWTVSQAAR